MYKMIIKVTQQIMYFSKVTFSQQTIINLINNCKYIPKILITLIILITIIVILILHCVKEKTYSCDNLVRRHPVLLILGRVTFSSETQCSTNTNTTTNNDKYNK